MLQQLPTDLLNYLLDFVESGSNLELTCSQFCTTLQLDPHTNIVGFISAYYKVKPKHVKIFRVQDPEVYLPFPPTKSLLLSRCDSSNTTILHLFHANKLMSVMTTKKGNPYISARLFT